MSTDSSGGSDSGLRFETTPYEPDGGCPPLGWLLILILGLPCAVVSGTLTVVAFPLLLNLFNAIPVWQLYLLLMALAFALFAVPVVLVVRLAVYVGKVRNPAAATVAALIVWATMVGTSVSLVVAAWVVTGMSDLSEDEVGSFIAYAFVSVVIALFLVGGVRHLASQPFCGECGTWKKVRFKRKVGMPPQVLLRAVRTGDVLPLAEYDVWREGLMTLTVTACPNCGLDAPSEVKLEQTTQDSRGRPVQTVLAHVRYPGSAAVVFEEIFRSEPPST